MSIILIFFLLFSLDGTQSAMLERRRKSARRRSVVLIAGLASATIADPFSLSRKLRGAWAPVVQRLTLQGVTVPVSLVLVTLALPML